METNALRKMADSSHLERMGRELKCPICLSLLNSTVSLTCNHVFCNSCIEKSMKSASSCPVCKVPYRRREIRPAPHMDSLVSIYKSMEVASGFNIFVTQNLPLTKLADEENQSEGGRTSGRQKRGKTFQSIQQNHRGFKGKRSKQSLEINQENLNLDPVKKPSFPRKKRVQVPQCPPSETPVQPAMFEVGLGKITEVPPERGPGVLKEMPAVNEKGESIFTPFFWLRDEDDVEKLTQMTDGGHNMDISPPNAPCFSDIKDSDDEIPSKVPPKGEANITFNDANYFDSEMFEWTQRPCSPELCSSPPKIQVTDREEFDGSQIKESKLSTQAATTTGKCEIENIQNVVPKLADNVEVSLTFLSSPRIDNTNGKDRMKRSKNRSRKACKRTVKKQENRTLGEVLGAQAASYKMAKSIIGEKKHGNNVNSINSSNRTRKGEKEVVFGSCAAQPVSENFSGDKTLSAEANGLNLNEKTNVTNLPASSDQKETSTKIVVQRQSCHLKRLKIKTTTNLKCDQEQTCKKKKKISTCDDMSKDNKLVNGIQDGCTEASVKNTQQVGKFHCNSEIRNLQDSLEKEKIFPSSSRVVLHKCETVPNKNQCVFCHSTENSEAAGEMIHYVNGKPVAADYNKGSKVIHAHRNCTEWAPNVYFEDDSAINLEAELARSRRIRCCCCDIKGAALGCYEKSCHKSFHVPCAKLIPQCRWDNDNFVMLCPIHASSKLPSEMSGSEIKKKKTCIPKRLTKNHQPEVSAKHAGNTYEHWNSRGSPGKLVLCCSALTNDEKEIVFEFERLSGVAVLKKWDSSVTHIIASTDENRACRRTLKILMGVLEGKWILSMEWIKACMKAMEPVDEQHYEIGLDVHGVRDGPRLGRLRVLNKQPKLFDGCKFYFFGEFVASYRGYLHDLVIAAGGTVLQRKPISGDPTSSTFIIYSLELPDKCDPKKGNSILNQRRLGAEALASSNGGRVASNSWVLNSIAACKLQKLAG